MADTDPTLGELGRLIEREIRGIRAGIREDLTLMRAELAKFVLAEVYSSERAGMERRMEILEHNAHEAEQRLTLLKEAFDAAQLTAERRAATERRERLYNLVLPALGMLLSAVLAIWAVLYRH